MGRLTLLLVLVGFLIAGQARAHQGASGIVKERMDAMSDIGRATKSVTAMANGKTPLDIEVVRANGRRIAAHAARVTHLFPDTAASRKGKHTEAKPSIWTEWDAFERLNATLQEQAKALADFPKQGDRRTLKLRQRDLTATCRECHKRFRAKKHR